MTDFSKDELDVLATALDMMVRTEGGAMAQAGAAGIKDNRVVLLTRRLTLAISALAKIEAQVAEIDKVIANNPPQAAGG